MFNKKHSNRQKTSIYELHSFETNNKVLLCVFLNTTSVNAQKYDIRSIRKWNLVDFFIAKKYKNYSNERRILILKIIKQDLLKQDKIIEIRRLYKNKIRILFDFIV